MFDSYLQMALSQLDQFQAIESDPEVIALGNVTAAKECFLDRLSQVIECAAIQAGSAQERMKLQMLRGLFAREVRMMKAAA